MKRIQTLLILALLATASYGLIRTSTENVQESPRESVANELNVRESPCESVTKELTATGLSQHVQREGFSIDTIPDAVFARMQGKSFPSHCTVKREELRYLQVLHRNIQDSVIKGELVCNVYIAEDLLEIFEKLYDAHYPIEHIRLIDDYDADDERSMSDNNSSSFCFRTVSGTTKLSNHARGLAVDINTLYNPYVRKRTDGTLYVSPSNARPYVDRTKTFPYKIEEGDLCYRLFREHGFTWGGHWQSLKDYQHFEKPIP